MAEHDPLVEPRQPAQQDLGALALARGEEAVGRYQRLEKRFIARYNSRYP